MNNKTHDIYKNVGVYISVSSGDYGYYAESREMTFNEAEELLLEMYEKTPEEIAESDFIKDLTCHFDKNPFISKLDRKIQLGFDKDFINVMSLKYPQYDLYNYRFSTIIFEQDYNNPKVLLN